MYQCSQKWWLLLLRRLCLRFHVLLLLIITTIIIIIIVINWGNGWFILSWSRCFWYFWYFQNSFERLEYELGGVMRMNSWDENLGTTVIADIYWDSTISLILYHTVSQSSQLILSYSVRSVLSLLTGKEMYIWGSERLSGLVKGG